MNPALEAVLAIGTLAGAAGMLALLERLLGKWFPGTWSSRSPAVPAETADPPERSYEVTETYTIQRRGDGG